MRVSEREFGISQLTQCLCSGEPSLWVVGMVLNLPGLSVKLAAQDLQLMGSQCNISRLRRLGRSPPGDIARYVHSPVVEAGDA